MTFLTLYKEIQSLTKKYFYYFNHVTFTIGLILHISDKFPLNKLWNFK